MAEPVIRVEHLSKAYQLGVISHGTLKNDLESWWARLRGKADPHAVLGAVSPGATGTFLALDDVSFEVRRGETFGIIGRNGAGKSTLLKILSRITDPTSGRVRLQGRVASLLEVGTGFHPELTGRENVYLNGAVLGMTRAEIARHFDEIVSFSGVEKFIDTPVKRYSSGMYVRLAFSVAAHLNPEILIVDEVLAVGDAAFQKKCIGKMDEVAKVGRTILIVSHNLNTIRSMCTSCAVLDEGRLAFLGQPNDAIDYFLELGEMPMVPVGARSDRAGNGKAKAVEIKVYDEQGKESYRIKMGCRFSVELTIEGEINNAIIGVIFGNGYNRQIFRAYSYESCPDVISIRGRKKITVAFEKMLAVQGVYNVATWIGEMKEVADEVDNAITVEVIENDVFNTGRTLNPKHNFFYIEHDWKQDDI